MIGSTLALTLGATLLATFRLSGSPAGAGVLVFVGAWVIAFACAMHLGSILDRTTLAVGWRILLKGAAWVVVASLTAWAILRAPGPELLTGLIIVPPFVGVIGVLATGPDRRPGLAFLAVAVALSILLAPAAFERLG